MLIRPVLRPPLRRLLRSPLVRGGGSAYPPGFYTGFVASRNYMCRNQNTVSKQLNARTKHTCHDDVTSIQLIYANILALSGHENPPGATADIKAAVEYPSGTFTRVQFSGSDTGTIGNGSWIVSDSVNVTIPRGATFLTWVYWNSTAGILYNERGANTSQGEAMQHAASGLTDQTMGGTITHTGGTNGYGPVGIIGTTNRASHLFMGDSRVYGRDDSISGTELYSGEFARSFAGNTYAWCNASIGSTKAVELLADWDTSNAALRKFLTQYASHIETNLSINDITAGQTAAQLIASLQGLRAKVPGKPFIVATIAPNTDAANTAPANASENTQRIAFNNTLRTALPAGFTAYIEIADATESARDSGLWKTGYTADGLHETRTGHIGIVTAGAVNPTTLSALRP